MSQLSRARLHVKATIPPGDWLLGALPHNIFRIESCKLTANDHMQLLAGGVTIPFDGQVHDIRIDPSDHSRAPTPTLCLGAHLSLFLRNNADVPQAIEVQVAGTTADGPPQEEGTKALPELGCKVVLGVVAQEVVREVHTPGAIDTDDLVRITRERERDGERALKVAFEAACLSGEDADYEAYERAFQRFDRFQNMAFSAQQMLNAEQRRSSQTSNGCTLLERSADAAGVELPPPPRTHDA